MFQIILLNFQDKHNPVATGYKLSCGRGFQPAWNITVHIVNIFFLEIREHSFLKDLEEEMFPRYYMHSGVAL